MLNFLENHDEQRLASDFFCGRPEGGYAALAVSLLLNTAPFMLYFGQEMGERGMQAEGFSGLDGRTSIFDSCSVPALKEPDKAVQERYRKVLALAKKPAFASGKTFDLCYCQGSGSFRKDQHFAFLRSDGKSCFLVVANFGPAAQIEVYIPPESLDYLGIRFSRAECTANVPCRDFQVLDLAE